MVLASKVRSCERSTDRHLANSVIAHESPYLNKGNHDTLLRAGMTFTAEPGIYLENKFGVRHEDIYLVKENGSAEVISGKRAVSPYEP